MTIVSHYEELVEIGCDDCGFIYETGTENLPIALKTIKGSNWTIRCETDAQGRKRWTHHCGDCNGRNAVNPRGVRRG